MTAHASTILPAEVPPNLTGTPTSAVLIRVKLVTLEAGNLVHVQAATILGTPHQLLVRKALQCELRGMPCPLVRERRPVAAFTAFIDRELSELGQRVLRIQYLIQPDVLGSAVGALRISPQFPHLLGTQRDRLLHGPHEITFQLSLIDYAGG